MIAVDPVIVVRVACAPYDVLRPFESPALLDLLDRFAEAKSGHDAARSILEERLFELAGPATDAEAAPDRARARFALLALRRDVHSGRAPRSATVDVLRAERGPEPEYLQRWTEAHEASIRARASAADVIAAEDERMRQALVDRLDDPLFEEALRLVGRSLAERAMRLRARVRERWRASERQAAQTVLGYLARMATKTSPHGVFSATALGTWGPSARIAGSARPTRVTARLHVVVARRLAAESPRVPNEESTIGLNPSLIHEGSAWTWWRPAAPNDPEALERRMRIAATPLLDGLVERLETSTLAHARRSLLEWASARAGSDAGRWIDRLLDVGFLVDDDGIPHLEARPLRYVASRTPRSPALFERIENGIDAIEQSRDSAERMRAYAAVADAFASQSIATGVDVDALLRVDSAAALEVTLPISLRNEIERVLPRYARLFAALYPPAVRLAPYRARFLARHGADTEVRLAEIFHGVFDDLGGFARSSWPDPGRIASEGNDPEVRQAREAHERFRRFVTEAVHGVGDELAISEADLERLAGSTPEPRFSCGLLFQLVSDGRVVWNGIFGPGLAVARLAALHPPLARLAFEARAALVPAGALAAEIPYGHAGRTANAGLRPRVFDAEIELPGETPTPGCRTFPLRDLFVRYDSKERRFVLRSLREDVPVVPVLTSGLSPEGFISFLVAVGQQDEVPLGLFPDVDESRLGAMPRMVSGNTVLFRRRWSFAPDEVKAVLFPDGGRVERLLRLRRWLRAQDLPSRVFASSLGRTKPRFVDLGSPAFLPVLEDLASDGTPLVLREMLPAPDDAWFRDADGSHAIEFLAHVRRT